MLDVHVLNVLQFSNYHSYNFILLYTKVTNPSLSYLLSVTVNTFTATEQFSPISSSHRTSSAVPLIQFAVAHLNPLPKHSFRWSYRPCYRQWATSRTSTWQVMPPGMISRCVFSSYNFHLQCWRFKTSIPVFLWTAFYLLSQTSFSHLMILFALNFLLLSAAPFVFSITVLSVPQHRISKPSLACYFLLHVQSPLI